MMRKELLFLPWEMQVRYDPARFKVVNGARRIRKTEFLLDCLLMDLSELPPGSEAWYLAPTYRQAKAIAWRRLLEKVPKQLIVSKSDVELTMELQGRRYFSMKGTENRDSLRGGSPSLAAFDEYAFCDPWSWEEVVQPALSDKEGKAYFASTPRGKNHFYGLYRLGEEGYPGWKSWTFTSAEVGTVPERELDRLRRTMPYDMFRQEYEAVFLGYVGLIVPEFVPKLHPEGNIMPIEQWPHFARNAVYWGSGDYGRGPKTVFHWWAGSPDGEVVAFWEYVGEGMTAPPVVGRDIKDLDKRLLGRSIYRALDKSCWNKQATSQESVAYQLQRAGLRVLEADADFTASILALRTLCQSLPDEKGIIQPPKFQILAGTCHVLQHQLSTLEDNGKGGQGEDRISRSTPHDAFDSCRYGIMFRRKAKAISGPEDEPYVHRLEEYPGDKGYGEVMAIPNG